MKLEDQMAQNCSYLIFSTVLAPLTLFWFSFFRVYFGHIFFSQENGPNYLKWNHSIITFVLKGDGSPLKCERMQTGRDKRSFQCERRLLMVNAGWLGFIQSEIFLQIKFIIFQGCSTKQAAFLPGQLVTYNQLLIHHFSLFQNAILHKMLKLGF